jgi:hypothetical protein
MVCPSTTAALAPQITSVAVNQPMPTGYTGGSIATGTYFLTQHLIYQGSSDTPGPVQQTLVFDSTAQTVMSVQPAQFVFGTYATSGTTITVTGICGTDSDGGITWAPDGGTQVAAVNYTYASGVLTIFDASKDHVQTFTKQ